MFFSALRQKLIGLYTYVSEEDEKLEVGGFGEEIEPTELGELLSKLNLLIYFFGHMKKQRLVFDSIC